MSKVKRIKLGKILSGCFWATILASAFILALCVWNIPNRHIGFSENPVVSNGRLLYASNLVPPIVTKPVRTATLVVAASDSSAKSKTQADYICDGTDDQVQIQAAIDALPAGGGEIKFLEGKYNKSTAEGIEINKSNVRISGCGRASEIKLTDGINANASIFKASDKQGIVIEAIRLNGNSSGQSAGIQYGIEISGLKDSRFNIYFENCTRNASIENCYSTTVEDAATGRRSYDHSLEDYSVLWDGTKTDWACPGATLSEDTYWSIHGVQSLKVVTGAGGNYNGEYTLPAILDLTGKKVILYMRIDDLDMVNYINIELWDGADRFYTTGPNDANGKREGDWTCYELIPENMSLSGTPDKTHITKIGFRVATYAGCSTTAWWDSWLVYPLPSEGMVTLVFDDTYANHFTEAYEYMRDYGYAGVSAVIIDKVDTGGRLSLAQLKEMHAHGWDISSHSMTHTVPTGEKGSDKYEILQSHNWLEEHGFHEGSRFWIPPGGSYQYTDCLRLLDGIYKLGRSVYQGYTSLPIMLPYHLSCRNAPADPVATIKGFIDTAYDEHYWLVLYWHDLAGIEADFEEIIDYINTKGIRVVTFSDVYDSAYSLVTRGAEQLKLQPEKMGFQDHFQDCLAASTNYVHAAITGTGAEQEVTTGITNPDVPRNISITTTNVSAPSGDVTITGVDAKGNSITEDITIVAGGNAYGNKAFSMVSKITIPEGVTADDTVAVGMSDKLGLSNVIYATGDVYKVKKNNADATIGTVDATNGTVDCATITGADDFTIYYRSNLNIIS